MEGFFFAQTYWQPVARNTEKSPDKYYELDISVLRNQLRSSQVNKSEYVIVEVPTLEGELEKFKVRSFSVLDENLAEKYQLGSYTGVSLSAPHRVIRFSISPNDFQCMISDHGKYEFINPERGRKGIYRVHPKTHKSSTSGKVFECSVNENHTAVKLLDKLYSSDNQSFAKLRTSDDQKYRTLRIAISTTGEYTQIFGGIDGALAQINATMTRVNAVFERDLALHLNVVANTDIIYTDPATDPYSDAALGTQGDWNLELQKTLTKVVGEKNYDIGHLFGASGGGGNAGCIGCICISPKLNRQGIPTTNGKGSAFTSPSVDNQPYGDSFDIDFVAHEIGHQLGANHTFSYAIEASGSGAQVEPGSGSTIMGYAGLTSANVQGKSDAYFSIVSLNQIQKNLENKACDVEIAITKNTPPKIEALQNYTIPKQTPFVLEAKATDIEGDALTYTWEQTDSATLPIMAVTGDNTQGGNFRSLLPSNSPSRYFPNLKSVITGNLVDRQAWEAVSNVARTMNFAVTVRDNNAISTQQQVSTAEQVITVSSDGPFEVTSTRLYHNINRPITWDVANTDMAPYNVKNVKIDYTTDAGANWIVLAESTPNDGSEVFDLKTLVDKEIQVRITALDHIFYTISGPLLVTEIKQCSAGAPKNFILNVGEDKIVNVSWDEVLNAKYKLRYRAQTDTEWTEIEVDGLSYQIINAEPNKVYEVQLANVCNGVVGNFSQSKEFSFPALTYCDLRARSTSFEYISRVKITDAEGNIVLENNSDGVSGYSSFVNDGSKLVELKRGSKGNKMAITIVYPTSEDFYETISAWIDFNGDGKMSENERIVKHFISDPSNGNVGSVEAELNFDVPEDAVSGEFLRLRIALKVGPSINSVPANSCNGYLTGSFRTSSIYRYGEVEDYGVKITL